MQMRKSIVMAGAMLVAVLACLQAARAAGGAVNDRIRYDKQCFTINGHDTIIYSGCFHYFRCPKPLWRARFQSMKSAGLNTVQTYVAWDKAEQTPPKSVDDYSKINLTNLHDWLHMAIDEFGFNVIIRPGPYICAEWDGGGYPQWLRLKEPAGFKGMWYRGDDPTYLAWCKHWYTAVAKVAAPFQITHQPAGKPGIILWQIENEYNYDGHSPEVKLHQLLALAHDSRNDGIDVPLITCQTENPLFRANSFLLSNVVNCYNSYPGFGVKGYIGGLEGLRAYQPDKPLMMTEMQGGWFSQVDGQLSTARGYNAAQIQHITMLAWAHGYTGSNYYMMFGGTNLGDWAAAGICTSYDYDAPIRECGGVGPRYQAVSSMAHMIRQIGPKLVRAQLEKSHIVGNAPEGVSAIVRKASDGTRFVFLFNDQQKQASSGTLKLALDDDSNATLNIDYNLPPFEAKLLMLTPGETDASKGQWLPELRPLPARPKTLPAAINITTIKHKTDPGPVNWQPLTGNHSEESAGIYDRRFVYYRATLPAKMPYKHSAVVCRTEINGGIEASVNGKRLDEQTGMGGAQVFPIDSTDTSELLAIYNNAGRPNGGAAMEAPGGILDMSLADMDAMSQSVGQWKIKHLDQGDNGLAEVGASVIDAKWRKFRPRDARELHAGQSAVYRCHLQFTPTDASTGRTVLSIGRIDDRGTIYVNGKKAAESTDWNKPLKLDLKPYLHVGFNTIAIVVHNESGNGGVGLGISLGRNNAGNDHPGELAYQIGTQCTGDAQKWYSSKFDDRNWETEKPADQPATDGLAQIDWYRMHVTLPDAPTHAWVPLKLQLDAVGDGFLYLNGHPLGRWWHQGPQRNFFLPDCWLNRGGDNVITVALQSADGVGVKSASVEPYSDLAEARP